MIILILMCTYLYWIKFRFYFRMLQNVKHEIIFSPISYLCKYPRLLFLLVVSRARPLLWSFLEIREKFWWLRLLCVTLTWQTASSLSLNSRYWISERRAPRMSWSLYSKREFVMSRCLFRLIIQVNCPIYSSWLVQYLEMADKNHSVMVQTVRCLFYTSYTKVFRSGGDYVLLGTHDL